MTKAKKWIALLLAAMMSVSTFGGVALAEEASGVPAEYERLDSYVLGSQIDADYAYANYWGLATTPHESEFIISKYGNDAYRMTDNACLFNLISPDKLANTPAEQQVGAWASIICYCVDVRVDIDSSYSYCRINLEDSQYFDADAAQRIRTIVNNGITVKTAAEVQAAANAWLEATGKEPLENVTAEEVLSAAQYAIWAVANEEELKGEPTVYTGTYPEYWSRVWNHDSANGYEFTYAVDNGEVTIGSRMPASEYTQTNIEALVKYYMAMEGTTAQAVAVSDATLQNVNVVYEEQTNGTHNAIVTFDVNSNLDLGTTENLKLSVICGDMNQTVELTETGSKCFTFTGLPQREDITVEINGYQRIADVFFFDANGERECSQTLVGRDDSLLPVHAEVTVGPDRIININKITLIDGQTYPLENIVFDIYYAGSVNAYNEFVAEFAKTYMGDAAEVEVAAQAAYIAQKQGQVQNGDLHEVTTLTTDASGKASVNLSTMNNMVNPDGIYLIVERAHEAIETPVAPFLVAVPGTTQDGGGRSYTIDLFPKNVVKPGPGIDKDVTEIGNNSDSFNVNEIHTWIIRGSAAVDMANGREYVITDTLDYRLSYAGDQYVKVRAGLYSDRANEEGLALNLGEDYTLKSSNEIMTVNTADGQQRKEKVYSFEVELTKAGMAKVAALMASNNADANNDGKVDHRDVEVRVYFDARIDEDALVGDKIHNQAALKYENSVGFIFRPESDKPFVYTCGIKLYKHAAKDSEKGLAGAVFKLAKVVDDTTEGSQPLVVDGDTKSVVYEKFYTDEALTNLSDIVITDAEGDALLYGLKEGTYYLVEIKAPAGYNLLSEPVEIVLNADTHEAAPVRIANSSALILPETGGIGTVIFTVTGGLMTLAGGSILALKKREEE